MSVDKESAGGKMKKVLFFVMTLIIGFLAGIIAVWNYLDKIIEQVQHLSDKHLKLFKLMDLWVRNYQDNKYIEQYLQNKDISKVAIYGLGIVGATLYRELKDSEIKVCYGIDQVEKTVDGINVLNLNDQLPKVDAIIVTPVTAFSDISLSLEQKINCKIISLEEIMLNM